MPEGRGGDPGARVGQAGGVEHGLDRAVLPERAVEADDDDRGRVGAQPADRSRRRRATGPSPPSAAGSSYAAAGRSSRRWSVGSHHHAAIEVDQDLAGRPRRRRRARRRWPCPRRPRRRARPTGRRGGRRSAAGPRTRSRHAGHGQPSQSPRNSISNASSTPWRSAMTAPDVVGQAAHVGGRALLVVDDEVGVLLGHDRAADPVALEASLVDEPAGRVAVRVAEHAAGRRQAERLVGLAPAADVVEALLDDVRVGRGQLERRPEDQLGAVRPRGPCLNRLSR